MTALDRIAVDLAWVRLIAICDEMAATLVRTSFSTVVRVNHDYACGLFDAAGTMTAQSSHCAPGHIGCMPHLVKALLADFPPESLRPGDVLLTNDPWLGAGHTPDTYVVTPVFVGAELVGFAVNSGHKVDIGGRLPSPDSSEVYEEGLIVPPMKLHAGGRPNEEFLRLLVRNVRLADQVLGDLRAQLAANDVGARRLQELLADVGRSDLRAVADAVVARTEEAMRAAIRTLPAGAYPAELELGHRDGDGRPCRIELSLEIGDGEIVADYAGTSPQVRRPINCVFNYTRALTCLGLSMALNPSLPNNEGAQRPITVRAPEGSLLNATFPAPLWSRTTVGHLLPEVVLAALARAAPDRVIAGTGSTPMWLAVLSGHWRGAPFVIHQHLVGGLGARAARDGTSSVAFPSNLPDIPVEVLESETPLLVERKGLRTDSGGAGRFRGGLGQEYVVRALREEEGGDGAPVTVFVNAGRLAAGPPGLDGGASGAAGAVLAGGEEPLAAELTEVRLGPGERLAMLLPGGGGYGEPRRRDPASVAADVREGLVSERAAAEVYDVEAAP